MNEIIERLQKEADEAKQEYISQICQIVIRHIKDCPADAERITTDKTLAGCFTFLRDRAKKNQKNGCGVCGDADVYDYFEFGGAITPGAPVLSGQREAPAAKPQAMADISIDDLFE